MIVDVVITVLLIDLVILLAASPDNDSRDTREVGISSLRKTTASALIMCGVSLGIAALIFFGPQVDSTTSYWTILVPVLYSLHLAAFYFISVYRNATLKIKWPFVAIELALVFSLVWLF